MRFRLWVLAPLLCSQASASDGWHVTTWGMTPQEVLAAVPGLRLVAPQNPTRRCQGDSGRQERVTGPFTVAGAAYELVICFSGDKLEEVRLLHRSGPDPLPALRRIYGRPDFSVDDRERLFESHDWNVGATSVGYISYYEGRTRNLSIVYFQRLLSGYRGL